MSALMRITDSSRTSHEARKVPPSGVATEFLPDNRSIGLAQNLGADFVKADGLQQRC
jgi:hypothetical protein